MAPVALFHRLTSFYSRSPEPAAPALPEAAAALLSVLFTVIYVAPFYASKATRPSPTFHRDTPTAIRSRIRAVTLSCIVSTLVTLYAIVQYGHVSVVETLSLLGWWPLSLPEVLRTLLLLVILFSGPLFEHLVVDGGWRDALTLRPAYYELSSWIGWRNLVAGPITEELVWRSLLIPLHLLAALTPAKVIFTTPLYFGIAHIHHFYEFRLTHPDTPALPALLRSLFQFTYTSFFGFFASFVFLRTGSVWAVIAAHSFCNTMGLPRVWGRLGVEAGVPSGSRDVGTGKKDDEGTSPAQDGRAGIGWTIAYYCLFFGGAYGFYKMLWPLTESTHALVDI
ncbi:CaaX prenyl proteinase Rce1 [Saccharata proteae CBS 121410]|uniref:intramembrane prenyl-peptidase Rce1 n=1 Tax=Saccharata proteae CBS 121410 TaxID=1314787 RepID=A0A9P4HQ61_9PEZI|nr:CaaX prenyl proteinase Rce1 [Saccharata proteae CBS 121410]